MSLENSPNSRVEFGDFLQTQVQNLQTHFFRKKQNLKNTHTQRLSLENSPNSRVEFGDFPELRFKRNKIPKTCFFFKNQNEFGEFSKLKIKRFFLSLENSPNSRVEFGDLAKLRFKRNKIPKNMFFFKNQNEFGEFSKLKCRVWRILQTQIQKIFF